MKVMTPSSGKIHVLIVIMLALAMGACAPTKPPVDELDAASRALDAARDAGAAELAPAEYRSAGRHFDAAQAAEGDRDYAEAAGFALQSLADSELAAAKARLARTRAEVDQLKRENADLDRDLATEPGPAEELR
jgi:hypothetical protein